MHCMKRIVYVFFVLLSFSCIHVNAIAAPIEYTIEFSVAAATLGPDNVPPDSQVTVTLSADTEDAFINQDGALILPFIDNASRTIQIQGFEELNIENMYMYSPTPSSTNVFALIREDQYLEWAIFQLVGQSIDPVSNWSLSPEDINFFTLHGIDTNAGFFNFYGDTTFIAAHSTVVPIPSAIWFLASGMLGLIGLKRIRPIGS